MEEEERRQTVHVLHVCECTYYGLLKVQKSSEKDFVILCKKAKTMCKKKPPRPRKCWGGAAVCAAVFNSL